MLERAISLAMSGRGRVEPNPMVGCVLVGPGGGIIGEGFHERVGGPHAEPTALDDCARRGNSARGATAYVTLEPCCHTNKRTPPCVPALIAAGVARVVIGCLDPNPDVDGKGVAQLKAAGIAVDMGSPTEQASACQLIAPFIARVRYSRPYVTLKWAESADGFISGVGGARRQISGPESMAIVHALRARCEAILIGASTLRSDNPLLTARTPNPTPHPTPHTPLRAVVSRGGDVPTDSQLFHTPRGGPTVLYSPARPPGLPEHVEHVPTDSLADVLTDLARRGTTNLLVESGGALALALARESLADRAWRFISPTPIGSGTRAAAIDWPAHASAAVGVDRLRECLNPNSPLTFETSASVDFRQLLAR
jgi:diaminohydroxyphosphoribosylaminopyrimidine deaminase / 5-amino-6-(5-phosphoribosylamino)uracil reductase